MDAAGAYLEPWTYLGALMLAARQLGFLNEHGEAQVGLVEVEVLIDGRKPFAATIGKAAA